MQWTDGPGANLDAAGRWSPGIGDPSVMGWVTVAVYLAAGVLCLQAARASRPAGEAWRLWAVLGGVLLALGLNKQLDLQSLFTQVARDLALAQGWYEDRRWVQGGFIGLLAAGGLSAAWWLRRTVQGGPERLAVWGLSFLMVFVVMRAASFHHMDTLINARVGGIRMNWVLELAGLVILVVAARRALKALSAAPQPGRSGSHPQHADPQAVRGSGRAAPGADWGPAARTASAANPGDPVDPPLIAWLRRVLAPVREPIARRLEARALEAARVRRAAASGSSSASAAASRSATPRATASTASASAASPKTHGQPGRAEARGEVTRIRRRG